MFWPREYAEEAAKYRVEPPLRILRRQFRNRRLLTNDGLQFRNQGHHQLSIQIQRISKSIAPRAQVLLGPAQQRARQVLKRLREGGIGNIALVLVELARCEETARRNQRFVELVDDG